MGSPTPMHLDIPQPYLYCRRNRMRKNHSQTPGNVKGCTATIMVRHICRCSRSYKLREYPKFIQACIKNNGRIRIPRLNTGV